MPDELPQSSHGASPPQPINPYAASDEPARRLSSYGDDEGVLLRQYRIRMDWGDRRRFMRSAGIYRILAVAGGVMGGYTVFLLVQGLIEAGRLGGSFTFQNPHFAVTTLLTVLRGFVQLFQFYLYWKLAEAMIATAGGRTGSTREWSLQQWNLARIILASVAISLIIQGWDWLYVVLLERGIVSSDL